MSLLNVLGDRNPQLLREWKSRLQPRGVVTALALSLLAQILIWWFFQAQVQGSNPYDYCQRPPDGDTWQCIPGPDGNPIILWDKWWLAIFRMFNWLIPGILIGLGMYTLLGDLQEEEQRGTLNFLRLSPRRGLTILWGKVLGVPSLIYLAIAAMIPFHLLAGLQAKVAPFFLISFYGLLLLESLFLFSVALLSGFLAARQGKGERRSLFNNITNIALPFVVVTALLPGWSFLRFLTLWSPYSQYVLGFDPSSDNEGLKDFQWYGLPVGTNFLWAHAVYFLIVAIAVFWLWRMLRRCYDLPASTPMSKLQSYGMMLSLHGVLFGFLVRWLTPELPARIGILVVLTTITWLIFAVLLPGILPHRQAMLDWERSQRSASPQSWWLNGAIGEQSPGLLALLLNLAISLGFCLPWLLGGDVDGRLSASGETWGVVRGWFFLALMLNLSLIALYGAIAQLALSMKSPKRTNWAVGLVVLAAGLPLLCSGILSLSGQPFSENFLGRFCLLWTPLSWVGLFAEDSQSLVNNSMLPVALGVLGGSWLLFFLLAGQLHRRLRQG